MQWGPNSSNIELGAMSSSEYTIYIDEAVHYGSSHSRGTGTHDKLCPMMPRQKRGGTTLWKSETEQGRMDTGT
jgi:hypothetical protein